MVCFVRGAVSRRAMDSMDVPFSMAVELATLATRAFWYRAVIVR